MSFETHVNHEPLLIQGVWKVEVWRGDGQTDYNRPADESGFYKNLIVNTGRTYLARRIAGGDSQTAPGSAMVAIAVGTGTTAAALTDGSTPGLYGEVTRRTLAVNSALSNNVYTATMTLGGAAQSVSSVALTEGGLVNTTLSGQGTLMQRVVYAAVTLADSDLFALTLQTNVGSNSF
jgi:hypothetical protein